MNDDRTLAGLRAKVATLEQLLQLEERIVTEQSARLKTTLQQWRTLAENAPDLIATIDAAGTVLYMNRRLGSHATEAGVDLYCQHLFDLDSRESVVYAIEVCFRTGEPVDFEATGPGPQGTVALYRNRLSTLPSHPSARLALLISSDVTPRTRFAEADSALAAIVEASRDAIIRLTLDGAVLSWNPGAEWMYGYSAAEVVGRPYLNLVPSERVDIVRDTFARIRQGERVPPMETYRFRKDGSRIDVWHCWDPIRDAQGRVTGIASIARDITERNAAEQLLRESNRRLDAALAESERAQRGVIQHERLRAIGTMASGIAHDFNNSLAAILGFAELLLARPELLTDPSAVRRHVDLIRRSAMDASVVVRRLREFYRTRDEAEVSMPVVINKVVEDAISLTQPRWKDMAQSKGIDIQVGADLGTDLPDVPANEVELREVLINLLLNAVDAMPSGGRVTISTRSDGRRVVVEIRDTGMGMTEEVRRRCIEPFFTTKGAHGSGLGLAMAYGVMQRHNGTIDIESAPGEGTRVRLAIPFRSGDTPLPTKLVESGPVGLLRVLVVDDEPLVREVVSGYLAAVGHEVDVASNGREGLERFFAGRYNLIVTDQGMPEMTGEQLAAAVKRAKPGMPVILLTGWGDQMKAAGASMEGVDLILSKPITLSTLVDAVAVVVSPAAPNRPRGPEAR